MLLQQSPFRGEDEDEIYDAILADEPLYPIHMPRDSVSILQKLLTREPDQRLGSGPTDAQEVMSQPFFRNINWDDIYHKRVQPPFLPQIKSATDTSNFDSEFTSVTPVLTPVQSGMLNHSPSIHVYYCANISSQSFHKLCKKSSADSLTRPTLSSTKQVVVKGRLNQKSRRERRHEARTPRIFFCSIYLVGIIEGPRNMRLVSKVRYCRQA